MLLMQPLSTALTGIQRGLDGMQQNASRIASTEQLNDSGKQDLITPLIETKSYQFQAEASAKMVKTIDQTLGSLLNIHA